MFYLLKLTAVNVAAANANYSSLDGVLFNKAQTELRAYPIGKEGAYIVPEGVETIMDAAFAESKKLTAITLPASLYEIASHAFENCTGLEMITSRASAVPSLGSDVFVGVNKAIPVFVPKANIALYKAEFGWEDFTNYIAIEDKEAADAVIAKINAIGTVTYTPECKARIDAARGGYDALTAEQKVYITDATYKILTDAEKAYADLKAKAEADQAAASAVIGKIDAIGTVTLESEAAILDARSAYNALTAAQQALVTNYSVLTAAEAKLEILKKQAESDEAAAKAVTDLINAIGTVTYTSESKARIDAAREAYDALTAAQKALVTNLTTLTAAEKAYADLKAKAEADQAAANVVIGKINAIGTVTYTPESKALIDAAREAYDALTDAQKGLVSAATYKILTDAEQTYADLKAKAEADQAAANAVIAKIDAIGTVTLSSEAAITAARSAYDALTAAQQALVTNYSVLTAAEAKLEILKKQAESDEAAANAVIAKIDAIGTVTLESEAAINAARSAYDALTATQKLLVTNLSTLTAAEKKLAELKANAEAVANAKLQLKNIVSQANELKMVAMLYAPTVVTDIDAIINDAQSTIDDPNATVDQVNAKVATLTDNLNTLAVSLLDQAKEQLKQSLRDLYQPGDYPSWYASVVIPALDQVDGITWDFSKSVQDNILYFQVTGQNLYNATKAALEALRGTDKRSIISSCAFTGFENGIKVDMTWNISALNNLINTLNTSVASEPYRLDAEMSSLGKWDPVNKELVILDPYEAQKLTAGDYQFITAVKIDGEDAKQYRLPKATEEVLSVTVDAAVWSVDLSGIVIDANYSFTYVTSPMFTISKSEDVELVNEDQLKTQKIYHNGHFYILRGEHIYDIRGTLVK
ncbi:MAG: leucine-rich repeat protein [Paludibacteraceae bacterium]|nr:leucine-rich repeat protein [Paludibacteraceae bacterium]